MKRVLFALALCVVLTPLSALASTITITQLDIGKSFTVLATGVADPGGPVSAKFDALIANYVIGTTTTTLVLNVTLTNTSAGDSSLRGYGFSANPNIQTGTSTGSEFGFDTVSTLLTTNPSVGNIENCVAGDVENQCTGLATDAAGLESGQVDTHTLSLVFNGLQSSVQLGDATTGMYFRFQSIGAQDGSAKIFGNPPGVPTLFNEPPTAVPEPASMLTLGMGLLAVAAKRRFKKPTE